MRGKKIRCLNADDSSAGRVLFIHRETETEYPVGRLVTNDPSSLIFNIPSDLPDGEYTLRVETYYVSSNLLLKSLRTIDYPEALVVGTSTSGGGDEEEAGGSPDPMD